MGPLGKGEFHAQEGRLGLSIMSPYDNHGSPRAENGAREGPTSQDLGPLASLSLKQMMSPMEIGSFL